MHVPPPRSPLFPYTTLFRSQNSAAFDRLRLSILLVDACGVIALSVLLARKLYRLVRDYRRHVPGSRLTARTVGIFGSRSEEHTSELQSRGHLVCRLLLEKKN